MTSDLFGTVKAIRAFGGSFMNALADVLEAADATNTRRLLAAFPEITKNYGPGTPMYARANEKDEQP